MHKIASDYIIEELKEESQDFGIITITESKISPDFSYVDFYVSSITQSELLTKFLAVHAQEIENRMCRKMSIRKVPKVRFRYDESGKTAFEIYQEIKKLPL
jgi:ribosome-binding factor A